jgi:hypothetical protein
MGDSGERRRPTEPRPLGGLGDLAELVGGDSERSKRFMGGLVAGAMVGAAIAGAALVRRRTSTRPAAERPDARA